jgi:ppGpp synthetase/RelA/SpoT-type nucleotidyltranferase
MSLLKRVGRLWRMPGLLVESAMASFGIQMAHSKSEVNRAGRLLADELRAVLERQDPLENRGADVQAAIQVIEWWREEHARPLSRVAANLRYYVGEEGKPVVAQRLKKFSTIAGKLLREPGMKLSRMADIGGVRTVLPDQAGAYRVAARLRRNWTVTQFRDYVAEPKPDGYRALHLVNRNRGRLIEVQLRTPSQDIWANTVETLARTIAPGLKFGGGPIELREYFVIASEVLARVDRDLPVSDQLAAELRDLMGRADTVIERAGDDP